MPNFVEQTKECWSKLFPNTFESVPLETKATMSRGLFLNGHMESFQITVEIINDYSLCADDVVNVTFENDNECFVAEKIVASQFSNKKLVQYITISCHIHRAVLSNASFNAYITFNGKKLICGTAFFGIAPTIESRPQCSWCDDFYVALTCNKLLNLDYDTLTMLKRACARSSEWYAFISNTCKIVN